MELMVIEYELGGVISQSIAANCRRASFCETRGWIYSKVAVIAMCDTFLNSTR